jgi:hypothetical protein
MKTINPTIVQKAATTTRSPMPLSGGLVFKSDSGQPRESIVVALPMDHVFESQEPSAPLNVGEQEGDGPDRKSHSG